MRDAEFKGPAGPWQSLRGHLKADTLDPSEHREDRGEFGRRGSVFCPATHTCLCHRMLVVNY